MKGIAATHLQCNECGTRTPIEDDEDPSTLVCDPCQANGEDPTCVELVAIIPCTEPEGECAAADHVTRMFDGDVHIVSVDS